jgi:pimeloyl-ACP methyl ester carboxylesterase
MARVRRGFVRTADGVVHYRHAAPEGEAPALALFHESPLSSVIFARALPLLGDHLRVWAFDTPGYGLSDPPPAPIEIPEYAARLLSALDALGIDRSAAGGGHTGASIAIEVALLAGPGRVDKVVLSGIPLYNAQERADHLAGWSPDIALDAEGGQFRWGWERYARIWGPDDPELNTVAITQLLQVHDRYNWAYNAAFRHDPTESFKALDCGILLLNPEFDLLNFADERALALKPNATLVRAPGLRGQLPWRRPDFYADHVVRFLAGRQVARTGNE